MALKFESENPSGRNPPIHPNRNIVRILKSVEVESMLILWSQIQVKYFMRS